MSAPESNGGASDATRLFTRAEALGGVSTRRARALLFLIEYWAAKLTDEMQQRTAMMSSANTLSTYAPIFLDESVFNEIDSIENDPEGGFYRAFHLTRNNLAPATLPQIEETAALWAPIVPTDDRLRAQVAHLLLKKYPTVERRIPQLRAALALDTDGVRQSYRALYAIPLANTYEPAAPGILDRLRRSFGGK